MKYKVNVGSHVTRYCEKNLTVYASSPDEAEQKAIQAFHNAEDRLGRSVDDGEPQINSIEEVKPNE